MSTFGKLLKSYRGRTRTQAGRRLTQGALGEAIGHAIGGYGYSAAAVSEWERDRSQLSKDDTLVLQNLIAILYKHGGIKTLDEAEQLLKAGNYRSLSREQIAQIEPSWLGIVAEPVPSPYRGLQPWREEDATYFYGRTLPAQQLVDSIEKSQIVTLVGAAGSGKTSLVQAGVFPLLRKSAEWQIAIVPATSQPFHAIATALLPLLDPTLSATERLQSVEELAEKLQAQQVSLTAIVQGLSSPLLLFFDDWDQVHQTDAHQQLLTRLSRALQAHPELHLLFALRTLDALPAWQAAGRILELTTPLRDDLYKIITEPAKHQNVEVEPQLVTELLDKLEGQPGTLPLLAYVLTRLWEQRAGLTFASYSELGGVERLLSRYADSIYERLEADQQVTAQSLFLQLVQPDGEHQIVRQDVLMRYLNAEEAELAQKLADERLLIIGQDDPLVQLAHPLLWVQWDLLREWIADDQPFWVWRQQLRNALQQWETNGKEATDFLQRRHLQLAAEWLAERRNSLNQVEVAFIEDSLVYRQQVRRWRVGAAVGIAMLLLLVVIVAGQIQRRQRARILIVEAQSLLAENAFEKALLRGLDAVRVWDSAEINKALAAIWDENPYLVAYLDAGSAEFIDFALLPNQRLLAGHANGDLTLWSTVTNQMIATQQVSRQSTISRVVASDTTIATGSTDRSLALRKTEAEQPYFFDAETHTGSILAIAFAPSGNILATGGDNEVHFWDAETGDPLFTPLTGIGLVRDLAFVNDDSLYIVTQSRQLWQWESGTVTPIPHLLPLTSADATGEIVAVGDDAGVVTLYPSKRVLTTSLELVSDLAFVEQTLVVIGCAEQADVSSACIRGGLEVRGGENYQTQLRVLATGLGEEVIGVAFSAEDNHYFVLTLTRIIILRDFPQPAPTHSKGWEQMICQITPCSLSE